MPSSVDCVLDVQYMSTFNLEWGELGYAREGDAGFDLRAALKQGQNIAIRPGCTEIIPTGIKVAIPPGFEIQIRSRSGLAAKEGLVVANSPGTIDSGYRNELKIILRNTDNTRIFVVTAGMRIAQAVVKQVPVVSFRTVSSVGLNTERGEGGLGHTGLS